MCCSAQPARFARTRILVHATRHPQTKRDIHVLAYQNTPTNLAASGGNAMILHIPSARPMDEENFVVADSAPRFMKDIAESVLPSPPVTRGGERRSSIQFGAKSAPIVFAYGDIYTVVLAQSVEGIAEALEDVPPNRRPEIGQELLDFYGTEFDGWTLALCCFDSRDAKEAPPVTLWFESLFPDLLIAPGIDAHDGKKPNLTKPVAVDHEIFLSHPGLSRDAKKIRYSGWDSMSPALRSFLPDRAVGKAFGGRMENGDFVLEVGQQNRPSISKVVRYRPSAYPAPAVAA
jgi:hypothetical protein